jgi:hypothetical protein
MGNGYDVLTTYTLCSQTGKLVNTKLVHNFQTLGLNESTLEYLDLSTVLPR